MSAKVDKGNEKRYASMVNPKWATLFFLGGGAVVIVLGVLARMLLGLSAASDRVFAVEALISGIIVIYFIQLRFRRELVVAPALKIPFVYIWLLLCAYVFLFEPLE